MINLEFVNAAGERVAIEYDAHPASQFRPVPIPPGATAVVIWLGTK